MQSQPREEPTGADNSDIETTTSHFMKDSRSEDVGNKMMIVWQV
jgi:hypothetical protein